MRRKQTKDTSYPVVPAKSSIRTGFLIEIVAVLILAGIPFALGKYFEFNQPDPFDGGAYTYSAWHIHQGGKLYVDEFSSARPGTLLANYLGVVMFGYREFGAEMIQMILQLAGLSIMFYTLRRCYGKTAAVICTSLTSIYLSAPLIAKFGNVKEQFMIPFMIASACFLMLAIQTQKKRFWIAAGAGMIWPFFFKPVGLSIFAAAGVSIILPLIFRRQTLRQSAMNLLLLSAGAIVSISPLAAFFKWQNCLQDITDTTPVFIIQLSLGIAVMILVIQNISILWTKTDLTNKLKPVPTYYWKIGIGGFIIAYLAGILTVYFQPQAITDDLTGYLYSTLFISLPLDFYHAAKLFFYRFWESFGTHDFYVTSSRKLMGLTEQAPIVFRYLILLKLPVVLALLSIAIGLIHSIVQRKKKIRAMEPGEQILWMLATLWICDMGMIWVSPRSYEQYYLPMCASAAILAGYGIRRFMERCNPVRSITGGIIAPIVILVMTAMVWPIFAGITKSPFSGQACQPTRGYVQSWETVRDRLQEKNIGPWEPLSGYIRDHSSPEDPMYVWGWYPGMYVQAQRLSSAHQAFEGNMHISPPWLLSHTVNKLLQEFALNPPKFIVDSRKTEFPWTVPPLELWPEWILFPQNKLRIPKEMEGKYRGFLSTEKNKIDKYEAMYSSVLAKNFSPEEAERFNAMKPFRDYVMQNYKVAGVYSLHVLFVRTTPAGTP